MEKKKEKEEEDMVELVRSIDSRVDLKTEWDEIFTHANMGKYDNTRCSPPTNQNTDTIPIDQIWEEIETSYIHYQASERKTPVKTNPYLSSDSFVWPFLLKRISNGPSDEGQRSEEGSSRLAAEAKSSSMAAVLPGDSEEKASFPTKSESVHSFPGRVGEGMEKLNRLESMMDYISTIKQENERLRKHSDYIQVLSDLKDLRHQHFVSLCKCRDPAADQSDSRAAAGARDPPYYDADDLKRSHHSGWVPAKRLRSGSYDVKRQRGGEDEEEEGATESGHRSLTMVSQPVQLIGKGKTLSTWEKVKEKWGAKKRNSIKRSKEEAGTVEALLGPEGHHSGAKLVKAGDPGSKNISSSFDDLSDSEVFARGSSNWRKVRQHVLKDRKASLEQSSDGSTAEMAATILEEEVPSRHLQQGGFEPPMVLSEDDVMTPEEELRARRSRFRRSSSLKVTRTDMAEHLSQAAIPPSSIRLRTWDQLAERPDLRHYSRDGGVAAASSAKKAKHKFKTLRKLKTWDQLPAAQKLFRKKTGKEGEDRSEMEEYGSPEVMLGLLPKQRSEEDSLAALALSKGKLSAEAAAGRTSPTFARKHKGWEKVKNAIAKKKLGEIDLSRSLGSSTGSATLPASATLHTSASDYGALLGNVSDDFVQKMQEWEAIKAKGSNSPGSRRKTKATSAVKNPGGMLSPPPSLEGSLNSQALVEELQRGMTDKFSKKLAEWERIKDKGVAPPIASSISPKQKQKDPTKKQTKKVKKIGDSDERSLSPDPDQQKVKGEVVYDREKVRVLHTEDGKYQYQGVSNQFYKKLKEWEKLKSPSPADIVILPAASSPPSEGGKRAKTSLDKQKPSKSLGGDGSLEVEVSHRRSSSNPSDSTHPTGIPPGDPLLSSAPSSPEIESAGVGSDHPPLGVRHSAPESPNTKAYVLKTLSADSTNGLVGPVIPAPFIDEPSRRTSLETASDHLDKLQQMINTLKETHEKQLDINQSIKIEAYETAVTPFNENQTVFPEEKHGKTNNKDSSSPKTTTKYGNHLKGLLKKLLALGDKLRPEKQKYIQEDTSASLMQDAKKAVEDLQVQVNELETFMTEKDRCSEDLEWILLDIKASMLLLRSEVERQAAELTILQNSPPPSPSAIPPPLLDQKVLKHLPSCKEDAGETLDTLKTATPLSDKKPDDEDNEDNVWCSSFGANDNSKFDLPQGSNETVNKDNQAQSLAPPEDNKEKLTKSVVKDKKDEISSTLLKENEEITLQKRDTNSKTVVASFLPKDHRKPIMTVAKVHGNFTPLKHNEQNKDKNKTIVTKDNTNLPPNKNSEPVKIKNNMTTRDIENLTLVKDNEFKRNKSKMITTNNADNLTLVKDKDNKKPPIKDNEILSKPEGKQSQADKRQASLQAVRSLSPIRIEKVKLTKNPEWTTTTTTTTTTSATTMTTAAITLTPVGQSKPRAPKVAAPQRSQSASLLVTGKRMEVGKHNGVLPHAGRKLSPGPTVPTELSHLRSVKVLRQKFSDGKLSSTGNQERSLSLKTAPPSSPPRINNAKLEPKDFGQVRKLSEVFSRDGRQGKENIANAGQQLLPPLIPQNKHRINHQIQIFQNKIDGPAMVPSQPRRKSSLPSVILVEALRGHVKNSSPRSSPSQSRRGSLV